MSKLIEVKNLKKYFNTSNGVLHAVDNVSFSIEREKTLGIVGESGCGKSTLGRVIMGLLDATEGAVFLENEDITRVKGKSRRLLYQRMQMIFQDPFSSLDPRLCTSELIAEPLKVFKVHKSEEALQNHVAELMETVGISDYMAHAYPHELDGGRRQRIGIARALALEPEFIVCDEPVSALDVSVQAQVLNLLKTLQRKQKLTLIFITHDLSVVKHISDDILVMYSGQMVEKASVKALFKQPLHPYTQGLLAAIPRPTLKDRKAIRLMEGEIVSPIDPEPGCRFALRCPHSEQRCKVEQPEIREVIAGHFVSCHFVEAINPSAFNASKDNIL